MGTIVIDIPSRENRRYLLDDAKEARALLDSLENAAVRIRKPASRSEIEDAVDLRNVRKAIAEFRRTGNVRPWSAVKADLGL